MQIEFNGNTVATDVATVAEFLAEQNIDPSTVATAVNGDFVPRSRYASEPLVDGVKLEVLSPKQGG